MNIALWLTQILLAFIYGSAAFRKLFQLEKVRADQELKRTFRAVYDLPAGRFTQLATKDMPDVRIGENRTHVLGVSNVPYRQLVSWDGNYDDYYLVKLADGSRQKILDKEHFGATVSPGGNYILYFDEDDDNWYSVRVSDGQLEAIFADEVGDERRDRQIGGIDPRRRRHGRACDAPCIRDDANIVIAVADHHDGNVWRRGDRVFGTDGGRRADDRVHHHIERA